MLDVFRERLKGPVAKGILGAVFFSFVFTGVGLEYFARNSEPFVAKVNGKPITKAEFDQAAERQKQQYGESYKMLAASPEGKAMLRKSLLDQLINERLLDQMLADSKFIYSIEQVHQELVQMPQLQRDGQFSDTLFKQVLRENNLTPKIYIDSQQIVRARQQMLASLQKSAFSLDNEVQEFYQLDRQTRDFSYLQLPVARLGQVADPSDDQLKAYFEQHQAQFVIPEKIQLEYVELDKTQLAQQAAPTEAEIQKYYDERKAEFKTAEKIKPAHILIAKGSDEKAAEAKAEALLKELKQGADFAALAAANSADTQSAQQGGELDWQERTTALKESILGKEFDTAVQGLKQVGELTSVIKTKYGFHLIKLAAIEAPKQLELAAVTELIKTELQRQKAENRFFEVQGKLKELSFEFPDALDEVAAQTGLSVKTTELFARTGGAGIAANPKVVTEAFSDAVLLDKKNSEPVELEPGHVLVIRVKQHQPSRPQPLDEVKADIKALVSAQQAKEKVKAEGERLLALLKEGKLTEDILKTLGVEWKQVKGLARTASQDLDPQIRNQAFRLVSQPAAKDSAEGLVLASGDYLILQLDKVELADPAKMTADERKQQRALLQNAQTNQQLMALLDQKRKESEIEIKAADDKSLDEF